MNAIAVLLALGIVGAGAYIWYLNQRPKPEPPYTPQPPIPPAPEPEPEPPISPEPEPEPPSPPPPNHEPPPVEPPAPEPPLTDGWRIVGPPPLIETARITKVHDNGVWIDFEIVVRRAAGELAGFRHRLYAVPPGADLDTYPTPFKEDVPVNNVYVVDRVTGQPDGLDLYVRAENPRIIGKRASPWAVAELRL